MRATHKFLTEKDILEIKDSITTEVLSSVMLHGIFTSGSELVAFIGTSGKMIEMLFVDPRYFGKRLGKRLLEFAVNDLGCTEVDVNEQNQSALQFYKSMGFVVCDRCETDNQGRPFPLIHMKLANSL